MKKLFFVIILIASFVPCLFAQDVQPNPVETYDDCITTASQELVKAFNEKASNIILIIKIAALGVLFVLSYYQFLYRNFVPVTKAEAYQNLLRSQKQYKCSIIASSVFIGLSIVSLILQCTSHKYIDILLIVCLFIILCYYLLLDSKNQEDIESFINKTTSDDFDAYAAFGKFPDDMTENERQRYSDISQEVTSELGNGLSGNKTEKESDE